MTNGSEQETFVPAEFTVTPISEGVVDIAMFDIRFKFETGPHYARLDASSVDGQLIETSEITSKDNVVEIALTPVDGEARHWTVRRSGDRVRTTVTVGAETYEIPESDQHTQGIEAARILNGKRKAGTMRYLRRFSAQYTKNADFRKALADNAMALPNGGAGAGCAIACTCCLVLPKTVLCCEVCAACILF